MYEHPATRANLDLLRVAQRDHRRPPTAAGWPRAGEWGVGRLAEPARILETIEGLLGTAGGSMDGLRVLVTAGGTREPIDSVRYVGNRSSGRMGLALAADAARRGAEVTVVAANVALPVPAGVRVVEVQTAAELLEAARAEFDAAHVLLMAAAVADFRPGEAVTTRSRRAAASACRCRSSPPRTCWPRWRARARPARRWSGSPPSTATGAVERGRSKLERKGLDAVVVNDISRPEIGFDAADNEVAIVTADGDRHVPLRRRRPWPRRSSTRSSGCGRAPPTRVPLKGER